MQTCSTSGVRGSLLLLLLAWLTVVQNGIARADRDIVYAATCYRWSGHLDKDEYGDRPQRTLENIGPSHLFRINPDGTGRTQLTFSHYNDTMPRFAPDGRRILFVRQEQGNLHSLCLIAADGGTVTTLVHFPPKQSYTESVRGMQPQWSPDGRVVGYIDADKLHLLTLATRHERVLADVEEYAWSPNGRRLYHAARKTSRFFDLQTGRITPVTTPILCPLWIDANRVLGTLDGEGGYQDQITACVLGRDGKAVRRTLLDKSTGSDNTHDNIWYATRPGSPLYVVEAHHHMSDGDHPTCVLANIITGHVTDLDSGGIIAISPDGKQCLRAEGEWIGPYKRGGRRGGPLNIVEISSKNVTDITSKLMTVTSGDWRRPITPRVFTFTPSRAWNKSVASNKTGGRGDGQRSKQEPEHAAARNKQGGSKRERNKGDTR